MIRLDIEKAYDHIYCSIVTQLMFDMGFGARMHRITFVLALHVLPNVMFNVVSRVITWTRSLRQGCPLTPLLFAIATHPILLKMHELVTCREIITTALLPQKQIGSSCINR